MDNWRFWLSHEGSDWQSFAVQLQISAAKGLSSPTIGVCCFCRRVNWNAFENRAIDSNTRLVEAAPDQHKVSRMKQLIKEWKFPTSSRVSIYYNPTANTCV
jgi:hypothetical protein